MIDHKEEYESPEWQEIRDERLEYDEWTCQDCGIKAEHVHHLKYPARSIHDCISLCEECHLKRHGRDCWEDI